MGAKIEQLRFRIQHPQPGSVYTRLFPEPGQTISRKDTFAAAKQFIMQFDRHPFTRATLKDVVVRQAM